MLTARIKGATRYIGKTQGYLGLPVRDSAVNCAVNGPDTPSMTTAWEPTPDEMERLKAGAFVQVTILGTSHPPITVTVGDKPDG